MGFRILRVVPRLYPRDLGFLHRAIRVPFHHDLVQDEIMGEMFGVMLAAVVLISFVVLALYVLVGVAVCASTLRRAHRGRQLANDLDQVLAEFLGPRTSPTPVAHGSARPVRPD